MHSQVISSTFRYHNEFSARLKHSDQGGLTRNIRTVEKLCYERVERLIMFAMEKQ